MSDQGVDMTDATEGARAALAAWEGTGIDSAWALRRVTAMEESLRDLVSEHERFLADMTEASETMRAEGVKRGAEQQTAYDAFAPDAYRVRIRDNGSHVAIMTWNMVTERFVRVNISVEDFRRITSGVGV